MRAVCWVGGCKVLIAEGESLVELERRCEEHRRLCHEWVKPGRVHRIEEDPVEPVVVVPVVGVKRPYRKERWLRGVS